MFSTFSFLEPREFESKTKIIKKANRRDAEEVSSWAGAS
jgi:hypothetical protein